MMTKPNTIPLANKSILKERIAPCGFDHNGECLICDCWITECAYDRYLNKDYKYETEEQLAEMFKNYQH